MSRFAAVNLALVLAVLALVAFPLIFVSGEYAGSDNQGQAQIEASHPNYVPWFSPLYEPPSGEVASGLFAAQAAIGGAVLGYYFGVARTRRRRTAAPPPEAPQTGEDPRPA